MFNSLDGIVPEDPLPPPKKRMTNFAHDTTSLAQMFIQWSMMNVIKMEMVINISNSKIYMIMEYGLYLYILHCQFTSIY